jgi:predicted RNase H-like HicB family nuclease
MDPSNPTENKMKELTLEYWEDNGWCIGRLIEIPGVFSQGETLDELKENIQDAYKMMVESQPLNFLPPDTKRITLELRS